MVQKINIVCWKWKPIEGVPTTKKYVKFQAYHVNALFAMLQKYVRADFRLICVTDDSEGINSEIEIIPLWNDFRHLGGCFTRLVCFKRDFDLFGDRFVSIDLDCVIVQDITSLLLKKGDFIVWAPKMDKNRIAQYCGGFWIMDAGARPNVYEDFDENAPRVINSRQKYLGGTDQLQISKTLQNELTFTQEDGIYNFVPDIKNTGQGISRNVKIIFFNGRYMPDDPYLAATFPWIATYYPAAGKGEGYFNAIQYHQKMEALKNKQAKIMSSKPVPEPEIVPAPIVKPRLSLVLFWWGSWPGGENTGKEYISRIVTAFHEFMPDIPYRIVLYTDAGLDQEFTGVVVRHLRVPVDLKWNLKKMFMFSPESGLDEPTICFDLDCIITGPLAPLVDAVLELRKPVLLITCQAAYRKKVAGGSIVGFIPQRKLTKILWDPILTHREEIEISTKGSERVYYRQRIPKKLISFWEDQIPGKILSYKRDCQNKEMPEGASVIRFHGHPRPHEVKEFWS